nr:MAG TPA: hypothetical protein [Caudoviricetes sp.]
MDNNMNEKIDALETVTDVATNVADKVNTGNNNAVSALILVGAGAAGAILWNFALKPAGKAVHRFVKKRMDERNKKKYDNAVKKHDDEIVDAPEKDSEDDK